MKFCNNCKVNVNKQLDNCPLCGKYLDRHNDNDNCKIYKEIEDISIHPTIEIEQKINFLQTKFNKLMLLTMLICVVLNIVLTPAFIWSPYVIVGGALVMFCIIMPIADKIKLQNQVKINLFILTLSAVALEFVICISFGIEFEWFSMLYILPWVYVGAVALIDGLIVFRRYDDKGLFATLLHATLYAIAPQILMWIFVGVGIMPEHSLTLLIIFFAVLVNFVAVLIVCTRALKEELERDYNI